MWKTLYETQERIRGRLRHAWLHRVFGESLFRKHLWVHDRRAIVGGFTLGVFIALTPTIPLQMLLATLGVVYFRLNLPAALAACWITNPLTLGPIYLTSWKLGRFVLEEVIIIEDFFDFFARQGRINTIVRQSAYLWTGSLVVATTSALATHAVLWSTWGIVADAMKRKRAERP